MKCNFSDQVSLVTPDDLIFIADYDDSIVNDPEAFRRLSGSTNYFVIIEPAFSARGQKPLPYKLGAASVPLKEVIKSSHEAIDHETLKVWIVDKGSRRAATEYANLM
jgi:hypothetical protein